MSSKCRILHVTLSTFHVVTRIEVLKTECNERILRVSVFEPGKQVIVNAVGFLIELLKSERNESIVGVSFEDAKS